MGWYLRKALKLGPLRLNLSKSGLGVSAGVKGLRLAGGPRGAYIHAGRGGFYFRQRIGGLGDRRTSARTPAQATVEHAEPETGVIATAGASELVEDDSRNLLRAINGTLSVTAITPIVLSLGGIATGASLLASFANWVWVLLFLLCVVTTILVGM